MATAIQFAAICTRRVQFDFRSGERPIIGLQERSFGGMSLIEPDRASNGKPDEVH